MSTHCIQIFVKFLYTFLSCSVVSRGVEQVGSRHKVTIRPRFVGTVPETSSMSLVIFVPDFKFLQKVIKY
jgi:hypothetical protein